MRALNAWGMEKSATIRHLRILWGEPENITDFATSAGPVAMSLFSLVAKLWLPNLQRIYLHEVVSVPRHRDNPYLCVCFSREKGIGYYEEESKLNVFGADGPLRQDATEKCLFERLVLGMDRLVESCSKVWR
jgi:hypothetical protein